MSKNPKYYHLEDQDWCYQIEYYRDYMVEHNLPELKITEMKREIGGDFFFCKAVGEVGEKSEGGCGIMCDMYEPRNGKNGICKHHRNTYEETENVITLTNLYHKKESRNESILALENIFGLAADIDEDVFNQMLINAKR